MGSVIENSKLRICCVHKLFWMSKQKQKKTICVHNMFWAWNFHVLNWWFKEQSVVILWVSWYKNKNFWQSFTCTHINKRKKTTIYYFSGFCLLQFTLEFVTHVPHIHFLDFTKKEDLYIQMPKISHSFYDRQLIVLILLKGIPMLLINSNWKRIRQKHYQLFINERFKK